MILIYTYAHTFSQEHYLLFNYLLTQIQREKKKIGHVRELYRKQWHTTFLASRLKIYEANALSMIY